VTATPNIVPNTPAPAQSTSSSRTRDRDNASDDTGSFDNLVTRSAHEDNDTPAKSESKPAVTKRDDSKSASDKTTDNKTQAPAKDAKDATNSNEKPLTVDQALQLQMKALLASLTTGQGDETEAKPETKPGKGRGKTKDAEAAALPAQVLQDALAKTAKDAASKVAAAGTKKAAPVQPHDAQEKTPATAKGDKGEEKADPLKVLGEAANSKSQPVQQPQSATAKVLHDAMQGKDGANAQSGGDKQDKSSGDQAKAQSNPADMLTKPAAQSAAANAPQGPAAQHGQAQPQAPDALMAAAPVQAQQAQTAHPINASLHIGPQADAVAQPNIDALAVNIAAKSKDGEKHFDIRLDPAELGRVDVKLSIDDAGKTQASLTAEKPQTLELLQRDRQTLERALRDAGLDLTGGGLNFSLKGQERDANTGSQPRGRGLSVTAIAETNAVNAAQSLSRIASADSRLDIRV
jgi:hypothetical protein